MEISEGCQKIKVYGTTGIMHHLTGMSDSTPRNNLEAMNTFKKNSRQKK
jgi:hypothetical protein